MVSVSRVAGPPHFGQVVWKKPGTRASGEPPSCVISICSGNRTGNWSSGTGTRPSVGQLTIGMGVPQYRCRLTAPVAQAKRNCGFSESAAHRDLL